MEVKYLCIFGCKFKKTHLLDSALVHPSIKKNNEFQRLEFLGDRVISFYLAQIIYSISKNLTVGEMAVIFSSLVSAEKMNQLGKFQLAPYLKHQGKLTKNVVADTLEAVIGALFLDGIDVEKIIKDIWIQDINSIVLCKNKIQEQNKETYKTTLNKIGGDKCEYTNLEIKKDHGSMFQSSVKLYHFKGEGKGRSKREAEEDAAKNILDQIHKFSKI